MMVLPVRSLEKQVNQALLGWFSSAGFTPSDSGGVERWREDRYDYIGCVVNRIGGENRVVPFGQMGWLHHQRIYSHFMSEDPGESNKIAVDVQLKYAHFVKDWTAGMRCQQEREVEGFLSRLRAFVMDELYPCLMSFSTPSQVLDLYLKKDEKDPTSFEPPSWFGASSALIGLILARLHEPEQYQPLKERYRAEFDGLDGDRLSRANRLIKYLDQPDPLPSL